MKLDASVLRYLTKDDFRILSALEIGSKNHEVVPLSMLARLVRMRPGGVNARLSELARHRLVSKEHHTSYEGFRLTYGGYDYLALHALALRGSVEGVGRQIGVGKESDVYLVHGRYVPTEPQEGDAEEKGKSPSFSDDEEEEGPLETFVLKIERLGRTSFRTVKTNRDYIGRRKHVSWMFLSRLAAEKEWAFLRALHRHAFPVPRPVDWNRHCIVMEAIDGRILDQLHPEDWATPEGDDGPDTIAIAQYLYGVLMRLLVRIAEHGLIHGDFNEFNLMVKESFLAAPADFMARPPSDDPAQSAVIMIDFPQMVSTSHVNAAELFERDVTCLRLFFARRFGFEPTEWPVLGRDVEPREGSGLDAELKASGFAELVDSATDGSESGESSESSELSESSEEDSDSDSDSDGASSKETEAEEVEK